MTEHLALNRSRNCHCCGGRHVREQRRVGTPVDPDYAVAVCPVCDVADGPSVDEKDATASDDDEE